MMRPNLTNNIGLKKAPKLYFNQHKKVQIGIYMVLYETGSWLGTLGSHLILNRDFFVLGLISVA